MYVCVSVHTPKIPLWSGNTVFQLINIQIFMIKIYFISRGQAANFTERERSLEPSRQYERE